MRSKYLTFLLLPTILLSACTSGNSNGYDDEFVPSENPATSEDYTNSEGVPIDTNSREYITGLTIGVNFSDASDAGAIGEEVCATARDRRVLLNSGGYFGVDPKTASFLLTDNGFQGCIDGFNGVPQY